MKLIHCADIHLGSKIQAKLPREKADIRKNEVRVAFSNMVEYAKREGINIILISGDLFDCDRPLKKDKEYFYSVVKSNPEIDFLYLRGNHDSQESYTEYGLENLKSFDKNWKCYEYADIHITGIEICSENTISMYSTLKLDEKATNIVMLHGYENVNLVKLINKNIDYLALGHLHTYKETKLDERGVYAYSGCLEGRGFDEIGEKGFVVIDVDSNGKINSRFIRNSIRIIEEHSVDITNCETAYNVFQTINSEVKINPSNLYRINLIGNTMLEDDKIEAEIERFFENKCFFMSVKNKAKKILNIDVIKDEISIRGEFVRNVLSNKEFDEDTKNNIIETGLKAISLQGVEI